MKYVEESCAVELSVPELCDRAFMHGDIGGFSRFEGGLRVSADAYREIQRAGGMFYFPETEVVNTCICEGIYYTVSGVCDGIIKKDGKVTVDLIRSVRAFEFYAPPGDYLLSTVKCHAYFYACREELQVIGVRIVLVNSDSGKIKYYNYTFDTDELRIWYKSVIMRISHVGQFLKNRTEEVLPSAENAVFPYKELREGQEIMIRECFSAIKKGERAFIQAPTGTGKTVSALYPAIRAVGESLCDKIFYLTAKSSTRREAYRAAGKLFEAGARLRTVVITAKEQVCLCGAKITGKDDNMCNAVECEFAAGYYDRAESAIFELLSRQNGFTRQIIKEVALKYRVCPYELSLDLSEYCDIIICDYNYVFDPLVYFRRYFADGANKGKYIFLLDEAHNLADRARDMYSATLKRSYFEKIYSHINPDEADINEIFEKAILVMRGLKKLCKDSLVKGPDGEEQGFYMSHSVPQNLMNEFESFKKKADAWLKKNADHLLYREISSLVGEIKRYITVSEYFDERFLFYTEIYGGDTTVKIYCLDPSNIMNIIQNRAESTILFSATLTPSDYFADVLGGGKKARKLELPSPFDSDNLCVAVADYISVRYEDRKKNVKKYASVIAASVCSKPGNYIVYFPSYDVLESVQKVFSEKYPNVQTVVQKRNMTQREREEFLDAFKDDSGVFRIGFCVLGGAFSEGVDLPGSRLIGTVIFGVGLPGLSNEKNIIRDYYEVINGSGYDYAYTFPGMNNVLQAAGRVIRQDSDRGIVILVDDRYGEEKYRRLFPEHWKNIKYAGNAASLAEIVRRFWNEASKYE